MVQMNDFQTPEGFAVNPEYSGGNRLMTEVTAVPFEFSKLPKGDPLLNEVYKLRYKVYCDEWGFEKPEDHPSGIEKDEFDDHSVHFIARRKSDNLIIGTIRLIKYSAKGFLIEQHCQIDADLSAFDKTRFGELSRLAVSKEYRKRTTDAAYEGKIVDDAAIDNMYGGSRRMENDIVLGLYKCIYRECLEGGQDYLLAVMAKGLYLLLRRVGIIFEPIGPTQNYHGLRTPYLGNVNAMVEQLMKKNPLLYNVFLR
jgi:N-acyl amino acid synthase of PEP-CTERM/exosortase system